MKRNIVYWGATGLVAIVALLGGFSYVTNTAEAIENFRHVGYPQQLRVLLGIAKLAGAIVLLLPRLPTLKEWPMQGFTFTWIAATVAHYLAADGNHCFRRVLRAAGGFVRDAAGESPRSREVDAGVARQPTTRSGVPGRTAASALCRRSSCPMSSRNGGSVCRRVMESKECRQRDRARMSRSILVAPSRTVRSKGVRSVCRRTTTVPDRRVGERILSRAGSQK